MALGESKQPFGKEGVQRMKKATKEEQSRYQLRLNKRAMDSIKVLSRKKKSSIASLMVEAINDLLVKHDRKPLAKSPKRGRPVGT